MTDLHLRPREDGKFDVLEGTADEPGRVVTTLDTREEGDQYITDLHQYVTDLLDELWNPLDGSPVALDAAGNEEDAVPEIAEFAVNATGGGGGTFTTTNSTFTVTAHAAPPAPPASFFTDPQFDKLERYVTITPEGRFTTHLAAWGECHVGYGDMCISPPREADYSHFHVGSVLTSDGTTIPTGVIAITGGHADVNLDAASARSKYDDTATGKVDVAIGVDEFGIWASGAMRANATADDVHTLRASGVSGDWRLIDGQLRLIGICSVNVPGFPKLALASSADHITALVAAGGPPLPHPDLCDCNDLTSDITTELDRLSRIVADAGLEDSTIEKLASRVLTDDELDTLYSRIATSNT